MSTHAVTLRLPLSVYQFFKSRAQKAQTSVESELLELAATAAEDRERLPEDLAEATASLDVLDDAALWQAARRQLAAGQQEQLEALNFKQQSEGLTREEQQDQQRLLHAFDRVMLVRANAAKLLRERGYNICELE